MSKVKNQISKVFKKTKVINLLLTICLISLIITTYQLVFSDKFFPRSYIGDSNITFLTKIQAQRLLESKISAKLAQPLELSYQNQKFTLNLQDTNIDYNQVLQEAFTVGHQATLTRALFDQVQALFNKKTFTPQIKLSLDNQINEIAKTIDQPPIDATIWLDEQNQIYTKDGENGRVLDQEMLKSLIFDYLVFGIIPITLPVKSVEPQFSSYEAQQAKLVLESIKKRPITLTYQEQNWSLDLPTLYSLLNLDTKEFLLDQEKLASYLNNMAQEIDVEVAEGLFTFDPVRKKVTVFQPSRAGQKLDQEKTAILISLALDNQRAKIITLPVEITQPKIQTAEANTLGIKELIGKGVSYFAGSIPNRIFNVSLTAARLNGVLISPGEVFSFNKTVGDISAATGFKEAYVIKSGRTVLDDGGGVCQDSTTLFRAVLNAGLEVLERTAHAYRVGYYEQGFLPGLDATVFHPSVDFKFKNDTKHHILIQAATFGTTLTIDLYGTSDGRVVTLSKPVVTNITPAPPELRQDDPTLAKGTIKQVDWAAQGATVSFTRTVTRNLEVIHKEVWKSVYKPWQAVYLVGTQ